MQDLLDTRAAGCDLRCQIGQAAGPIADDGGEAAEAAVRHEAALDHTAEDVRIDITAGKQKNDALSP